MISQKETILISFNDNYEQYISYDKKKIIEYFRTIRNIISDIGAEKINLYNNISHEQFEIAINLCDHMFAITESGSIYEKVTHIDDDIMHILDYLDCILFNVLKHKYGNLELVNRTTICQYAAEIGDLECLKYAHEHDCPLNKDYCTANAALGDHLECLIYACENGCLLNVLACTYAAIGGSTNCLKYIFEDGPHEKDLKEIMKKMGTDDEDDSDGESSTFSFRNEIMNGAIESGNLACVKYLHGHGCSLEIENAKEVARCHNMPLLEYILEYGDIDFSDVKEINVGVCKIATKRGHVDILDYMHRSKRLCGYKLCEVAIEFGRFDCLSYLIENGYVCDDECGMLAVRYGRLDCLKYLHANGRIQFTHNVYRMALLRNDKECAEYILSNLSH